jgi:hypothetical protein
MTRRTTLRPVESPVAPPPPASFPRPQPRGPSTKGIVGGLLIVALVVVGIAFLAATSATRSAPEAAAVPTTTVAPMAATPPPPQAVIATAGPACPSIASFLDVIGSYERQARWGLAASTAQTALRTPSLCEADRSAIGQKLVALSREALFEQPPAPEDAPGQRRVVAAYIDLKTLAMHYGVQPPAPLPIAQSAYDNRLFLLATAAYADAFANGDTSADDRAVIRADYAAQYNLGLIWAHRTQSEQRQDGLIRLATACRIDEQYQLGSAEACSELQTLLGPRTRWPSPVADPLIHTPGFAH